MSKVHEGMDLQPAHFDAIIKHLRSALVHFGVSTDDTEKALDKVDSLRGDILYK